MSAVAGTAGTIGRLEMLEDADEPGIVEACAVIGLILHEPANVSAKRSLLRIVPPGTK
jgi:hypothetical protein